MSHFVKYCSECNKVISQCRCMDCRKTVLYDICDECKKNQTPSKKIRRDVVNMFLGITDYTERCNLLSELNDTHKKLIAACAHSKQSSTEKVVNR